MKHLLTLVLLIVFYINVAGQSAFSSLAESYAAFGDYMTAVEYESKNLEMVESLQGKDNEAYAKSLNNLSYYQDELGNYEDAIRLCKQAMEILKEILGERHPNYTVSLSNLANYYSNMGNYQEAIRLGTCLL